MMMMTDDPKLGDAKFEAIPPIVLCLQHSIINPFAMNISLQRLNPKDHLGICVFNRVEWTCFDVGLA